MKSEKKRLNSIDTLRGLTMISMIIYHFCWDLKYINGFDMDWYGEFPSYVWQQSICWTFILISGFCVHLAKRPVMNGLIVFLCGVVVSCVTVIFIPEAAVMFGILTFMGSAMILVGLCRKSLEKVDPLIGFVVSAILFCIFKNVNRGYLQLFAFKLKLPSFLYKSLAMTYLGFKEDGFYSTDYFSLLPWIFLFVAGFFAYGLLKDLFGKKLFDIKLPFISWFGRHSLVVYMLHQPILYGVSMLLRK